MRKFVRKGMAVQLYQKTDKSLMIQNISILSKA